MKLVIGGSYQGKQAYASRVFALAEEDWVDGRTCTMEEILKAKGVHHFHTYVRKCLEQEISLEQCAETLIRNNPALVLVTNELGYGVVPMDPFERRYREVHGRLCGVLAGYADEVHRVMCGIGTVIKG